MCPENLFVNWLLDDFKKQKVIKPYFHGVEWKGWRGGTQKITPCFGADNDLSEVADVEGELSLVVLTSQVVRRKSN